MRFIKAKPLKEGISAQEFGYKQSHKILIKDSYSTS
jgi:hypothetical protein